MKKLEAQEPGLALGLRANSHQLALLVVTIAFVGAMVGMERSILPLLAEERFAVLSRTGLLSFVLTFGLAKAFTNFLAGCWSDRYGRRNVLLAGWLTGLPVPFMIMFAPTWEWIVAANALLGIQQGLCWSAALTMKIDLAGSRRRGLVVGLNEGTGYVAVALAALGSAYVAARFGLQPWPLLIGVAAVLGGLIVSWFTKDTLEHVQLEPHGGFCDRSFWSRFSRMFTREVWTNRRFVATSQAGLMSNLNDGVAWGLFPLHLAALGANLTEIGWLVALYPAVWGVGQFVTGALSDRIGRRIPIASGMLLQAVSLAVIATVDGLGLIVPAMIGLGLGTALVHPTLISAVSDDAPPADRASLVGVFRFWRDMGYAAGALAAGVMADRLGIGASILIVALLTGASGVVAWLGRARKKRGEAATPGATVHLGEPAKGQS